MTLWDVVTCEYMYVGWHT